MSAIEEAVRAAIDPGAFAEWVPLGERAEAARKWVQVRQDYKRSVARNKAYEILQLLDIAPETYDWPRLFEAMADTIKEAKRERTTAGIRIRDVGLHARCHA